MAMNFPWGGWGRLLICCSLAFPMAGMAQTNVSALLTGIESATDRSQAQNLLNQLWLLDSTKTYLQAETIQRHWEESGGGITRTQADTLMRIYAIGCKHDPHGSGKWLLLRARLALSQPDLHPRQTLGLMMEAIALAPRETPPFLYTEAGHLLAREYKSINLSLNAAAKDWVTLDRALLERKVSDPQGAAEWARIQEQLTLEMRSCFPDCRQLQGDFSEAIGQGNLPPDACETFLVICSLQGCDESQAWEEALQCALKAGENPWLHRLAGAEAFNRGQIARSRTHWQKACSLEVALPLQASDQLQIAATYQQEKDFREARSCIQAAMDRQPGWGVPYLQLMDLYLAGSETCKMSAFERKALHWLLIDLCLKLSAIDESCSMEANQRYYAYLKACPTKEEAAFYGWKAGDTYPLKCWMSTATTVRLP
ncbi:MAG: hypothetical protein RLZZ165_287 [Bacteroidota bacterium]|jgi:tetratricopeptide (TPR) repeat protein